MSDIFQEIDEDLRQDKVARLWKAYGKYLVALAVFIILVIAASVFLFDFSKKELIPTEDRGVYLIIGSTDEGSSFEYTQEKAQIIENRIIKLLQAKDSPYERVIMRVPGFGKSATTYNTFIIIALLDEWKKVSFPRRSNS